MSVKRQLARRDVLRSMGLAAAGIGLAACAPQVVKETVIVEKQVEKVVTATPAPIGPVTLNLFGRSGDIVNMNRALTDCNWYEEHPEITVETMGVPSETEYWTKLLTMAAGGMIGSVFWTSIGTGGYQMFVYRDMCLDLGPLIEADQFDIDDFDQGALDALTINGKLYALPRRIHPSRSVIWYNVDLFAEAGVPEPTDTWTWEDLANTAQALTKDTTGDGRIDQWGFVKGGQDLLHAQVLVRGFDGWVLDKEGKTCLLNSPEAIAALTWDYNTVFVQKCQPPAAAIEKSVHDMFLTGKMGMIQLGWWGRRFVDQLAELDEEYRFKIASVPLPKSPTGKRPSAYELAEISIASSIRPEIVPAAWELMKGLTSVCANIDILKNIFGPARKSVQKMAPDVVAEHEMASYIVLSECMEYRMCANARSAEYQDTANSELAPLWLGNEQPTQAFFDKVTAAIQEVLDLPMPGEP